MRVLFIRFNLYSFLLLLPFSLQSYGQSKINIRTQSRTFSIYSAPFALLNASVGPSIRGGIEKEIGEKSSLFAEYSHYIPTKIYQKMKGFRIETGYRFYLDQHPHDEEITPWLLCSIGLHEHIFENQGFFKSDPSQTLITKKAFRQAQFLHFGLGQKIRFKNQIFIDFGVLIGIRHRNLLIDGLTKIEDDDFKFVASSDSHSAAIQTGEIIFPDLSFNIRIGWESRLFKQKTNGNH